MCSREPTSPNAKPLVAVFPFASAPFPDECAELKAIIIATGSEVHLALAAADKLGDGVRVVSMPCMEIFNAQSAEYRLGLWLARFHFSLIAVVLDAESQCYLVRAEQE